MAESAVRKELKNAELWRLLVRNILKAEFQYDVHGNDHGYQPIVLERSFYGMKPQHKEISEEFRLFHNLYFDSKEQQIHQD